MLWYHQTYSVPIARANGGLQQLGQASPQDDELKRSQPAAEVATMPFSVSKIFATTVPLEPMEPASFVPVCWLSHNKVAQS